MKIQHSDDIVIAGTLRTPIGQINKSLAGYQSYELGKMVAEELIKKTGIPKEKIEAVITAEIGQSSKAPNVSRVISVALGLPVEIPALTIANNCVSSFEAIVEAVRRVLLNEQEVILVIGTETMSNFPIYLNNARRNPKTANTGKLMKNLDKLEELEKDDIKFVDSIIEGLTDPATGIMMIETGEIAAQNYDLSKETLDDFAYKSYKNSYDALTAGKYDKYMMKMQIKEKEFDKDEFIMSKKSFVDKPQRFAKSSAIYGGPYMSMKEFYDKFGRICIPV
jgi:acetyl-CoA C-acetyltransferase